MPPSQTPPITSHLPQSPDLSGFTVLDARAAIALMDDSEDLYRDIALAYLLDVADVPQQVQTALQARDLTEALRVMHTFKGLSLTVGAKRFSEICLRCETQTKRTMQSGTAMGEQECNDMVHLLRSGAEQTREALQTFLSELDASNVPSPDAARQGDGADALIDLKALRQLLAASDLQALDSYAELRARHQALHEAMSGLDQALKAFDFGQAVVQCDEIIRRLASQQ